jgi:hypothetical protein
MLRRIGLIHSPDLKRDLIDDAILRANESQPMHTRNGLPQTR